MHLGHTEVVNSTMQPDLAAARVVASAQALSAAVVRKTPASTSNAPLDDAKITPELPHECPLNRHCEHLDGRQTGYYVTKGTKLGR